MITDEMIERAATRKGVKSMDEEDVIQACEFEYAMATVIKHLLEKNAKLREALRDTRFREDEATKRATTLWRELYAVVESLKELINPMGEKEIDTAKLDPVQLRVYEIWKDAKDAL